MKSGGRPTLAAWSWLVAALLMLGEFLLFDAMTSRHHASVYPRWNDQIQYLTESYYAYDEMKLHGLAAGLRYAWDTPAVQGKLHNTAAVVLFWLAGSASRSAALSLNLLVLLAWQAALLYTLPRVTGSRALGWMGFGLVLAVAFPWSAGPGSAVDFRLDHGAMCLFGVAACAALLADGFRSTRWSLGFGLAAGAALLERFLSGAYLGPIFFLTGLWLLYFDDYRIRLRNLLFAGLVVAAMALPVFWTNREGIYGYYWQGHVTNAESAARLRGFDFAQSVRFVLGHLGDQQLGAWFGRTVAGLTGLLLLFRILWPRRNPAGLAADWLFFGLLFLLVPAVVLVIHPQKSEAVLGIMVPGTFLLVLWGWRLLWTRTEFPAARAWHRLLPALPAVAALAAGGVFFVRRQATPPHRQDFLDGARQINQVADYIFTTVQAAKLDKPSVGMDQIVDYIDGRILRLMCYERHRVWIFFAVNLPDSILAGSDEGVFQKLQLCDFMILTDYMPGKGYWPYDQQMSRLYPQLKAWCNEHLRAAEIFTMFERDMTLYQRKELPWPPPSAPQ